MERNRVFNQCKIRLKASSLLETIVASIVFLIVFSMAMTAAINLRKFDMPDWAKIETEFNAIYKSGLDDDALCEYDWGSIEITFNEYQSISGLYDVQAIVCLKDGRQFKYRYLFCNGRD